MPVPRDLDPSKGYAIGDDVGPVTVLDFRALQPVSHSVRICRYGEGRVKEYVQSSLGETVILGSQDHADREAKVVVGDQASGNPPT